MFIFAQSSLRLWQKIKSAENQYNSCIDHARPCQGTQWWSMFIILKERSSSNLAWPGWVTSSGLLYYISIYKLYSTFFFTDLWQSPARMAVAAVEERKGVIAGLSDDDQHPGHQMILKLLLMWRLGCVKSSQNNGTVNILTLRLISWLCLHLSDLTALELCYSYKDSLQR